MKTVSRIAEVRQALRQAPDGMTVPDLMKAVPGIDQPHLSRILNKMADAYIDRWEPLKQRNQYRAVWCVVIPPDNCPKPEPDRVNKGERKWNKTNDKP